MNTIAKSKDKVDAAPPGTFHTIKFDLFPGQPRAIDWESVVMAAAYVYGDGGNGTDAWSTAASPVNSSVIFGHIHIVENPKGDVTDAWVNLYLTILQGTSTSYAPIVKFTYNKIGSSTLLYGVGPINNFPVS